MLSIGNEVGQGLGQGSQTCGPRHHEKLQTMAEITVLGAVNSPYTLYLGPRRPIFIFMWPASSFFVKMWPSNEFEFETPGLGVGWQVFGVVIVEPCPPKHISGWSHHQPGTLI